MPRVLILSSLFAPNIGGVENSINALAQEFIKLGYEVNIVCSNRNYIDGSELPLVDKNDRLNIYRYKYPSRPLGYFYQFTGCFKVLKENDLVSCDIVMARSAVPAMSAFFAGVSDIKYLVPSIYFFQEQIFKLSSLRKFLSVFFNSIVQLLALLVSKNLVFSTSMIEQVKKASLGIKAAYLVSPGVDSERFKPISLATKQKYRNELGVLSHQKIVLGLGRFSELKQFDHAIECMRYLDDDVVLFLVGDGPERARYEELVKTLNLSGKVKIFPSTKKPELYYQVSDAFVMTSRYESFGQVLLEATSSGVPIVAYPKSNTTNTSVDFIYKDYPSLIFYSEGNNAKCLANAILDAIGTFKLKESRIEFQSFLERYSWHNLALDIIRV
ncbi:glycosyltransferase [Marinobacter changyiensis]|uniref:glycosyltransferase n=1 Tax=Marinobacter changyiensis TaxID=2604091 RepID=UPI0015D1252B|nr:glycosyltransferase [Marinobacter changyiensis]